MMFPKDADDVDVDVDVDYDDDVDYDEYASVLECWTVKVF